VLASLLRDPIPAVRAAAAVSLGELPASDSVSMLTKALEDGNPAVRAAAVSALFKLGVPYRQVAPVVRELTQNIDPGIRATAARALAKSRDDDAIKTLRELLDDPLPRPRIASARALGQIGDKSVVSVLTRALRDQDEAVRATAGGALGRLLSGMTPHEKALKKR
jgi:HEAT repeat protein